MPNKVSIFIKNTEGSTFELSNSGCAIGVVKDDHAKNWLAILSGKNISDNDIVLYYNNTHGLVGELGKYRLLQQCGDYETAKKIVADCRKMVSDQYERLMMIRVAKKYKLDEMTLLEIQREYHNSANYEINLEKYF